MRFLTPAGIGLIGPLSLHARPVRDPGAAPDARGTGRPDRQPARYVVPASDDRARDEIAMVLVAAGECQRGAGARGQLDGAFLIRESLNVPPGRGEVLCYSASLTFGLADGSRARVVRFPPQVFHSCGKHCGKSGSFDR
jgi:hypothetical protein